RSMAAFSGNCPQNRRPISRSTSGSRYNGPGAPGSTAGYGATQDQLAPSFQSPAPEYFAYCGYAQSGRDNPVRSFFAAIVIGVSPIILQFSIVPITPNETVLSAPRHRPMPGPLKG